MEPTCCSEHLSIGTETAVEDSSLMRRDLNVANQSWVTPNAQRIVGETTGTDDLAVMRAPSKASNLGAGVNTVDSSTSCGIPEVDVTVVGSSTSSEDVWLPWAPAEGLHGGLVVSLCELRNSQGASIPD